MVDTCGAGDVDMSSVTVGDSGTALEGDAVFGCAVKVMRGVKEVDLGFL